MATMKDFYAVCDLTDQSELYGDGVIHEKMIAFYDAVTEERGLKEPRAFAALPRDTVLGEKAQAALEVFKASVKPQ